MRRLISCRKSQVSSKQNQKVKRSPSSFVLRLELSSSVATRDDLHEAGEMGSNRARFRVEWGSCQRRIRLPRSLIPCQSPPSLLCFLLVANHLRFVDSDSSRAEGGGGALPSAVRISLTCQFLTSVRGGPLARLATDRRLARLPLRLSLLLGYLTALYSTRTSPPLESNRPWLRILHL